MEFEAVVGNERYLFAFVSRTSVLVSGEQSEYILYKRSQWHCADEISPALLRAFGDVLESHEAASAPRG